MKKALYWDSLENNRVNCTLCPHNCKIADGKAGVCKVRVNTYGVLYSTIYGEVTAAALDPVEKKPLYHFFPGKHILSVGTNGCNLGCSFCQNWHISQNPDSGRNNLPAEKMIELALKEKSIGIAYTYNEPLIWFETVLETAKKAREAGLKNVLVTNGYINEEPFKELLPFIDAMNIDLKSIKNEFYKEECGGSLAPVKITIEAAVKSCHVELTNLLVTSKNDSEAEIRELVDYIASVNREIPVHFSRYFPQYKLDNEMTPGEMLEFAAGIASEKLEYVYTGNVDVKEGNITFCPNCGNHAIVRAGYDILRNDMTGNKCNRCGGVIRGVFQ